MRSRRAITAVAASSACAVLAGVTVMAGTAGAAGKPATSRSAAAAAGPGHWGDAKPLSLAGLKTGSNPDARVTQLSCSSPGSCTAAGTYDDDTDFTQVFVAAEAGGVWGTAVPVPGLSDLNAFGDIAVTALSCASPGDCAVGGQYQDENGVSQPFVADSLRGTWGDAHALTKVSVDPLTAVVTSLSCTKPGDCAAGVTLPATVTLPNGSSQIIGQAFVADETGGTWSAPQRVKALPAGQPSEITSLSCWSPANCMAGGFFTSGVAHALLVAEIGGTWRDGVEVPGITGIPGFNAVTGNAQVLSVSCAAADACTAAGTYPDQSGRFQAFVTDQRGGTWRTQSVPGSLDLGIRESDKSPLVSCGAPGECGLSSPYGGSPGHQRIFAAAETGGAWGSADDVFGSTTVLGAEQAGVSCGGPGSCVMGGGFSSDSGDVAAYLAEESHGAWNPARTVAENLNTGNDASTLAVSCARPGNCAVGGSYADSHGNTLPFVADESSVTSTALSLSRRKVTFGREEAGHVTVHVKPRTGGTATGRVIVKARSATLCAITLRGGRGSCNLGATKLRPGSYKITAAYGGDATYSGSASAGKTLTVAPEPTKATLAVSSSTVRLGHERSEHFTVQVRPQTSGSPAGKVTITAGSTMICTITLKSAKGRCRLRAGKLSPGTYHLVATYGGDLPFAASHSRAKTLTVSS
jgi:hypothetical protein